MNLKKAKGGAFCMAGTNWQSEVRIQALVDTDTSHHPSSCRLYFGWQLIFNMFVWLYFLKELTNTSGLESMSTISYGNIYFWNLIFISNWVAFSLENIVFAEMLSYLLHWGLLSSGIYLGGFFSKLIFYIFEEIVYPC